MGEYFERNISLKGLWNLDSDQAPLLHPAGDVLPHHVPDLIRVLGREVSCWGEVPDGCLPGQGLPVILYEARGWARLSSLGWN